MRTVRFLLGLALLAGSLQAQGRPTPEQEKKMKQAQRDSAWDAYYAADRADRAYADSAAKVRSAEERAKKAVRDSAWAASYGCSWPLPSKQDLLVQPGDDICVVFVKTGEPHGTRRYTTGSRDLLTWLKPGGYDRIVFAWSGSRWLVASIARRW